MKTYAFVQRGEVVEIIPPVTDSDGKEIEIQDRYAPDFAAVMYDITTMEPAPKAGWTYKDGLFAEPVPYQPTSEEILARNESERDRLLTSAALAIAPLQDAVDLDDAKPEEIVMLKKWKQYRVAVNRTVLTKLNPDWPTVPV
ncbi:tail fiber assembly protein [Yersinia intermedia]|uniref:tail fiber assembly protein n=1 Tax=Yersinia intermedia TaxID=631 RepID=UPI0025AA7265|nr:tail fiber assembly protein [Yersinia intermedia]MDN0114353.1 tail fiber assembly protein [Yersinia intermedia]